jgi:hypothetical protein
MGDQEETRTRLAAWQNRPVFGDDRPEGDGQEKVLVDQANQEYDAYWTKAGLCWVSFLPRYECIGTL